MTMYDSFMSGALDMDLPNKSLYDSFLDLKKPGAGYRSWREIVPEFQFNPRASFHELVVPTKDTIRFSYLLTKDIEVQKPIFITGNSGVGKSIVITDTLNQLKESGFYEPIFFTFSAQTSSSQTQNSIISKLDSKRKDLFGGPGTKKVVMLIDDVNMPAVEQYGAQPPIELMRQFCDSGYFYERNKHYQQKIVDTTLVCCAAPPEGGRHPLTQRFTRHFHILCMPDINDDGTSDIFKPILNGFLTLGFSADVQSHMSSVVTATNYIYQTIRTQLLPTPARTHYTFNLRDMSKVFQGILMVRPKSVSRSEHLLNLWIHEMCRVFYDRLINNDDRKWFQEQLVKAIGQYFKKPLTYEELFVDSPPLIFGDFVRGTENPENRDYEEFPSIDVLLRQVRNALMYYNETVTSQLELVFFQDALQHLTRICRILRSQRGNAMLIGVGGCGKQSLTRLASYINSCQVFSIQVTKEYKQSNFRDDLKDLFTKSGGPEGMPTVFLLNDTQIVSESFLEDINNILNSGEVPNLFTKEELEQIDMDMRPVAEQAKVYENIFNFFINRIRSNLHIVLCMSPIGNALRQRMRMFPSLVNCCTINWVDPWPSDALLSVAQNKLSTLTSTDHTQQQIKQIQAKFAEMCVFVHTSVEHYAEEFYQVLSRKVYITPKSYLDMISTFLKQLGEKREELDKNRSRYRTGVDQLVKTNQEVIRMKAILTEKAPELEKTKIESEKLEKKVEADSEEANRVKEIAEEEEHEVMLKTQEISKLQEEAEYELSKVLPIMESALRALDTINQKDIAEIRTFGSPPALVVFTLECIAILLEIPKIDWSNITKMLQNNFIDTLKNFQKDAIKPITLKKLRNKISGNPDFTPNTVGSKNLASKSLCEWVYAIQNYAKVAKEVEPKRQHLENMNKNLMQAQESLRTTQAKLQAELDKVAALEAKFQEVKDETERLNDEINLTNIRLERANILTTGLKDEHGRWEQQVESLTGLIKNIFGDVFVSTACICYYGPFTGVYRQKLVKLWLQKCQELQIDFSEGYSLQSVMGDPLVIRDWNIAALPTDEVSINNGILVTKSPRYPLMIDPQEQANRWIKRMGEKSNIRVTKQTDTDFSRVLDACMRNGLPLLIEDVGEVLNPVLDPLLNYNIIEQSPGYFVIRMGETDVDFDRNFKLYMTSKLPNPHYLPDISIKVTIINFTVTTQGLEEQLLGDVVNIEEPQIEKQKIQILQTIADYQRKLKNLEDQILDSLTSSKSVLDDPKLVKNLQESKVTSEEISVRMVSSEESKQLIEEARNKYKNIAIRGSILYFVVADLSLIQPMYQFSLTYFTRLFNNIIKNSPSGSSPEERERILINNITEIIYTNICRGLFNAHKLIFSFIIAVSIMRNAGEIKDEEWSVLLRGVTMMPSDFKKIRNPDPRMISEKSWDMVTFLQNKSMSFAQPLLGERIRDNLKEWRTWIETDEPQDAPLPSEYESLGSFYKLMLVKCFREEKVPYAVINFVTDYLGRKFAESVRVSMDELYVETTNRVPIIFILSVGADPMGMMQRLAEDRNFAEKLDVLSLGKGQGEKAAKIIEAAVKEGRWVVLQNCHLAKSWMPDLEKIVERLEDPKTRVHEEFRLFLTSTPVNYFPVPVLQSGIKITNEPPKGIKANIERSLNNITQEQFEASNRPQEWKRLLFSLCFFHAVVQERRKFGPLGWNNKYEFNESDFETSMMVLHRFLESDEIPWDAIKFVTGEINYGGRVTDEWDRRCLMAILTNFLSPESLQEGYQFSKSGTYAIPLETDLEVYKQYVNQLPLTDSPEIFGMHDNANINFQKQESDLIIQTVLSIQPRETGKGASGKSADEIIFDMAGSLLERLPGQLKRNEAASTTFALDVNGFMEATSVFLGQELERYNQLLTVMKNSLTELRAAIKGTVVMSQELDNMFQAILNNKVPNNWASVAYASLKPLAPWFNDLKERVNFLRKWLVQGKPEAFWLNAFFFPQGFLTSVLQANARKYQLAIDTISYAFDFQTFTDVDDIDEFPDAGVYIYGLYMEGCRWNADTLQLEDSLAGEMYTLAPIILFEPVFGHQPEPDDYLMPVYKTSVRAGQLSTTGHSTNFIIAVECPTTIKPQYWVLKGAALLCQLNDQ